MMWLLQSLYAVTNSWGWSIILLTLLVRFAMHPLTQKQMVSMQRMQKLQPRLKVLQDKYADDKETLNREVMALYRENKVNPAAGCLPLLIQLPIFILLYGALTRHGFAGASFLWIHLDGSALSTVADAIRLVNEAGEPVAKEALGVVMVVLSAMSNPSLLLTNLGVWLPNTVLLLTIAFLTWYQQHLSASGNPQMAMMNWFMPIFLTWICLSLPGGVLLYWGVSSLMGVVHQLFVMRRTSLEMQEKPVLLQEKPAHKDE
jgi:YidC/Oxa1 family membrane protein insertase